MLDCRPKEMRPFATIGLFSVLTLLAGGCGPVSTGTDANLQAARKAADAGDFHTAARLYEQVVRAAPDSAQAHLELGLLYDERMGDPIAAIYEYRQFLALHPDPDKKQLVEDFIERAKLSVAAKLPQPPALDPAELTRLQTENAALRARVAELERPASPPLPEPAPEPVKSRTHVVQKGDTLQSLALRHYGTRSAWEKIYTANQAILPSKDQLKVGQQLVIP